MAEGNFQPFDVGDRRKREWRTLIHVLKVAALVVVSGATVMCLPVIMMGIIRRIVRMTRYGTVLGSALVIVVVTCLMSHSHKNPCEDAESQKQLGQIGHAEPLA